MTDHALLDRMARENRRLKIAVVVALAILARTALTAQLPPAERLCQVDQPSAFSPLDAAVSASVQQPQVTASHSTNARVRSKR